MTIDGASHRSKATATASNSAAATRRIKAPPTTSSTNCIAFGNTKDGFTDNSQTGDFTLSRNTAWNNAKVGFKFNTAVATLRGNVAAANGEAPAALTSKQISSGNSWNGGASWSNGRFKSVDVSLVQGARQADGRIKASNFLLPKSGEAIGATTAWKEFFHRGESSYNQYYPLYLSLLVYF